MMLLVNRTDGPTKGEFWVILWAEAVPIILGSVEHDGGALYLFSVDFAQRTW